MLGLRAQDIGELAYVAIFGSIIFLFIAVGFYFDSKTSRKVNLDLAILLGLFLFFGVGIDMVHMLFRANIWSTLFFVVLEDGFEMIVMSVILWYFYFLIVKPDSQQTYLYQYFFFKKKPKPIDC